MADELIISPYALLSRAAVRHCGDCAHFQLQPADPSNLGARIGLCLEGPPQIQLTPHGTVAQYPPLPPNFLACHRFEPRLAQAE